MRMWFIALLILPWGLDQDCGNGLPCGPVPWVLPVYPQLQSPTPANPFIGDGSLPTPTVHTPTAIPSRTPIFTSTPGVDIQPISESLQTVQAVWEATQVPVLDANGTPVADSALDGIASDSSLFFSYLRGMDSDVFGALTPLMNLLLTVIALILFITAFKLLLPIIAVMVGVIRKAIQVVMDFIPG